MSGNVIRRRRFPRRRYPRPVGILCDGIYSNCFGLEIGEGGMLINFPRSIPNGHKVVLTFIIPGASYIVVRGEIRYELPSPGIFKQIGVQFLNIQFDGRKMIREYIAKKTEDEAAQDFNAGPPR